MKVSLSRILFPTDFSQASECARNYACTIAGPIEAEVHVLHVASDPLPISGPRGSWVLSHEDLVPGLISKLESQLDEYMVNSEIRDAHIIRAVRIGSPVEEIVKYAARHKIDLIVLGTHGRTGLSHLLIGSVAEKVIRLSRCPVLTVHPQGHQFLRETSQSTCQ